MENCSNVVVVLCRVVPPDVLAVDQKLALVEVGDAQEDIGECGLA